METSKPHFSNSRARVPTVARSCRIVLADAEGDVIPTVSPTRRSCPSSTPGVPASNATVPPASHNKKNTGARDTHAHECDRKTPQMDTVRQLGKLKSVHVDIDRLIVAIQLVHHAKKNTSVREMVRKCVTSGTSTPISSAHRLCYLSAVPLCTAVLWDFSISSISFMVLVFEIHAMYELHCRFQSMS